MKSSAHVPLNGLLTSSVLVKPVKKIHIQARMCVAIKNVRNKRSNFSVPELTIFKSNYAFWFLATRNNRSSLNTLRKRYILPSLVILISRLLEPFYVSSAINWNGRMDTKSMKNQLQR